MVIIGILLNIVGLGIFCWALFALAIHALPFFVGMIAGIHAYHAGTAPFGAIVIGFIAAALTLVVGRHAFAVVRYPLMRLAIGLLFALPAASAGYDVTLAFADIAVPSEWWREAFALLGAIAVGCVAWTRVSILTGPAPGRGRCAGPSSAAKQRRGREQVTLQVHRCSVGVGAESGRQQDGDIAVRSHTLR